MPPFKVSADVVYRRTFAGAHSGAGAVARLAGRHHTACLGRAGGLRSELRARPQFRELVAAES